MTISLDEWCRPETTPNGNNWALHIPRILQLDAISTDKCWVDRCPTVCCRFLGQCDLLVVLEYGTPISTEDPVHLSDQHTEKLLSVGPQQISGWSAIISTPPTGELRWSTFDIGVHFVGQRPNQRHSQFDSGILVARWARLPTTFTMLPLETYLRRIEVQVELGTESHAPSSSPHVEHSIENRDVPVLWVGRVSRSGPHWVRGGRWNSPICGMLRVWRACPTTVAVDHRLGPINIAGPFWANALRAQHPSTILCWSGGSLGRKTGRYTTVLERYRGDVWVPPRMRHSLVLRQDGR